jgi:hypothetical protein
MYHGMHVNKLRKDETDKEINHVGCYKRVVGEMQLQLSEWYVYVHVEWNLKVT